MYEEKNEYLFDLFDTCQITNHKARDALGETLHNAGLQVRKEKSAFVKKYVQGLIWAGFRRQDIIGQQINYCTTKGNKVVTETIIITKKRYEQALKQMKESG